MRARKHPDRRIKEARAQQNDQTRAQAVNDRLAWTQDEVDLLMTCEGDLECFKVAAQILGRTLEACRQHYYVVKRGEWHPINRGTTTVTKTVVTTTVTEYQYDRWDEADRSPWYV
jgi:hypothetical protein